MGLKEAIVKGIKGVLQGIVNGISGALGDGIDSVVDLTTHVPKPQPADGIIFGEPTNGLWQVIYQSRTEAAPYVLVLGVLILGFSWFVTTIGETYTSFFDKLDQKQATSGLIGGFLAMYFSWWAFSALLWFSDGLTQFILSSTGAANWGNIIDNQFVEALSGSVFVTAIIAFVGIGLVLLTALLHVARIFGIFGGMYLLPILVGAYFGGVPVAKGIAKKTFKYIFVFATIPIPTALLVGLSATLITRDSVSLISGGLSSVLVEPFVLIMPLIVGFILPIFMLRSITALAAVGGLNRAASGAVPNAAKQGYGNLKAGAASKAKAGAAGAAGTAGGAAASAGGSVASGTRSAVTQPDTSYQNAKEGLKDAVPGASDIDEAIMTADDRATSMGYMAKRKATNIAGEYRDAASRPVSTASNFIKETVDLPNNPKRQRLPGADDPSPLPPSSPYQDETRSDARPNQGTAEAGPVPEDEVGRQDLVDSLSGKSRDNKEPTMLNTSDADLDARVQGDPSDIGDTGTDPESARPAGNNIKTPDQTEEDGPSSDPRSDAASSPQRSQAEKSGFEFGANESNGSSHPVLGDDENIPDPGPDFNQVESSGQKSGPTGDELADALFGEDEEK